MDKVDRKILFELEKNARASYAEISRNTSSSKDLVRQRIKHFTEKGIVHRYYPVINMDELGLRHYLLSIRWANIPTSEIDEIINKISQVPSVTYLSHLSGSWDVLIGIRCKTILQLDIFLRKLTADFGEFIESRLIHIVGGYKIFSRKFGKIKNEYENRQVISTNLDTPKFKLNQTDIDILKILNKSCRISNADIARSLIDSGTILNISRETVAAKIRRLEQNKIILAYSPIINLEAINRIGFRWIVRFGEASEEQINSFLTICYRFERLRMAVRIIGQFDFQFNIEAESYQEAESFTKEIMSSHGKIVRESNLEVFGKLSKWSVDGALEQVSF